MSCLSLGLGLIDWGDPCYQDLTQQMDSGDPIYSALANLLSDWTAQPYHTIHPYLLTLQGQDRSHHHHQPNYL